MRGALAAKARLATIEVLTCHVRVMGVYLRERHRFEHDAIHRACRYAEFAAGAVVGDHGVHQFRRTDDRIHRADLDALRAADAVGFHNTGQRALLFNAVLGIEREDVAL